MERSDNLHIQAAGFFQEFLHLHAVFTADIEVVAAGFAGPVIVLIAPEAAFAKRSELAEGIGTE